MLMRKYKFFLLRTVLVCTAIAAQAQEYAVEWDEVTVSNNIKKKQRLSFEHAVYDMDNFAFYHLNIGGKALENVVIIPLETAPITNSDYFYIPSIISETRSEISYYKNAPVTQIEFMPIVRGASGSIAKIVRFKLQYQEVSPVQSVRILNKNATSVSSRGARGAALTGSVLSSGTWHKLPINKDGIYKIDYDYLKSLGINPSNINPLQIRMFGNGGGMLPQVNNAARYDDLIENAIQVVGEQDGTFDNGDYILFYAKAPHTWSYNTGTSSFDHIQNVYSEEAYYFLNVGSANGLRVSSKNSLGTAAQSFNYFDDRQFYENDAYNIIKSGREWYGEKFGSVTSFNFPFSWEGAKAGSTIATNISVLGRSFVSTKFYVKLNELTIDTIDVSPMSSSALHVEGVAVSSQDFALVNSLSPFNTINLGLTFNNGGLFTSEAHLNAITLQGQRVLKLYGSQTLFRCKTSTTQPTSEYRLQNADASVFVWDVTDPLNPIAVNCAVQGTEVVFSDQSNVLREYVCFAGTNFFTPGAGLKVENQNLHAVTSPYLPDMVIVSHPSLVSEANRLAQHRKVNDNLDVLVVTPEQVYNEFSSGAQDITAIRDFIKMLYDRNTATDSIRYLLMFGDCSYDYLNRLSNNTNLVPCYQSRNSLDPVRSYSSEDYFGFMDNAEGNWGESVTTTENHLLDIFVGRIPATNVDQASAMVDKIIHYQSAIESQSKWKNRISFAADDGDWNTHFDDAEIMANKVASKDARYNLNKIYIDAYPQETSPGGEKSPVVKELLTKEIEKGIFVLNYNGHGGTGVWAQEQILTLNQIDAWKNINTLPLFVTATCDFGIYDDPYTRSGADAILFNGNGGGIGMVTATRVVYQYSNRNLNRNLYEVLFASYGTDVLPRIGDVMKLTKNSSISNVNNRNYAFLGDPSMKLAYPKNKIAITKINGTAVSAIADTMKALAKVTIEGEVRTQSNALSSGYTGTAYITCFDKQNTVSTLGSVDPSVTYTVRNNFFFEGKASITNGKFNVSFVVPKDILYLFGQGKVSMYASSDVGLNDAGGNYNNIQVGGSNTSAVADNAPPIISLYMNDESFVSGGLTNNNPLFIAKVSDENGINVGTGGIGHEITKVVSNNSEVVILNDYYSAAVDDYTNGVVRYPMKDFSPGKYSVKFKVWDTYNNSSEALLEFEVANTDKLALDHVLNYPNPFSTNTDFHFDHNRAGDDIEVLIQIYTVSGKLIKSMEQPFYASPTHISGLVWDGKDDYGDKIGKGVYVYKVNVRSLRDGSSVMQYQKLVLLN